MKKLLTYVGFCIIGIFTWYSLFHRSWPTPSLVSHARRISLLKTTWHSFKSLHWDFQWRAAGERILKIAMSLVSPFLKHGVYLSTKPEKCHRTTLWNAGRFTWSQLYDFRQHQTTLKKIAGYYFVQKLGISDNQCQRSCFTVHAWCRLGCGLGLAEVGCGLGWAEGATY